MKFYRRQHPCLNLTPQSPVFQTTRQQSNEHQQKSYDHLEWSEVVAIQVLSFHFKVGTLPSRDLVYSPDDQTLTWVWRPIWTQTWISSLTLDAHVPQTLKSLKMWNLIRFHKSTGEIDWWKNCNEIRLK